MRNATAPEAPPAATVAEKAVMLGAALGVAALLLIPGARETVLTAFVGVAHHIADVASAVARFVDDLIGLA